MRKRRSRLIVVDASVAQSAGLTDHPESRCCREALDQILDICHRMAMTPAIRHEWKQHTRRYSRKWQVVMTGKRKVVPVEPCDLASRSVNMPELSEKQRAALEKDLPLIEAACAADGIILTRDDAIRRIWEKCKHHFKPPKPIVWINPVTDGVAKLAKL